MKTIVYWIQGIPGSGKTTLVNLVRNKMRKWGDKAAIIDDEMLMHLKTRNLTKIIQALKKDYDFILICSVSQPRIKVTRHIVLDVDVNAAKKRHYKYDNVSNQEVEYERHWIPRSARAKGIRLDVGSKNPSAVYKMFYEEVLKKDLK